MISIQKYDRSRQKEWDEFCRQAKNSMFMFQRDFMEYHSDRFTDWSLMFYDGALLLALLPMNAGGKSLFSHGGLTFGGFITGNGMKQHKMNECFDALLQYMKEKQFETLTYKLIPHIYHNQPAEEDRYCLFRYGARLIKTEVSAVINLKDPYKMKKGRKAQISRARREGVEIAELKGAADFIKFIELENAVLMERHGVKAVHTAAELKLLQERFPDHIHLFGAIYHGELIAGTVVFEYPEAVHTQYMAAGDKAREIGALDLAVNAVIERYRGSKKWLDFGISTEDGGKYLNRGLAAQKEGFGGRTNVYETYELSFMHRQEL